jgi:hypothetical protein
LQLWVSKSRRRRRAMWLMSDSEAVLFIALVALMVALAVIVS